MLPTQKSHLFISHDLVTKTYQPNLPMRSESEGLFPQHLYIISDEPIEIGAWYYHHIMKKVYQLKGIAPHDICDFIVDNNFRVDSNHCKKVIATTELSIKCKKLIPRIPEQFIYDYCKSGGIDEINVEMVQDYSNRTCDNCNLETSNDCTYKDSCCVNTNDELNHKDYWISCLDDEEDSEIYKLRVDFDYKIYIHQIKNSWNREEVIKLCNASFEMYMSDDSLSDDSLRIKFNEWLEKI